MVALDIDGTLVGAGNAVSLATRAAIANVVDAGVPVVLSTGRSWAGTELIVREFGLPPGLAVMSNGSVVAHHQPLQVIERVTFDPEAAVSRALGLAPNALIAVESGIGTWLVNRPFPEGEINGEIIVEPLDRMLAEPATRVVIRDPNSSSEDFERLAEALGMHGVEYYVGWTAWIDIVPEGVTKATGLAVVADRLGVDPGDVLAVGDGNNDVEMLRWAGRGVAMGQATDDVRDAADAVTGSLDDDGLAEELDRWF